MVVTKRSENDELFPLPTDDEIRYIPLTTGSCAEFYTLNRCCRMRVNRQNVSPERPILPTPEGYPPPTELPAQFYSHVEVSEIIDSEYPGYVYLGFSYLLSEDSDAGKYNAT